MDDIVLLPRSGNKTIIFSPPPAGKISGAMRLGRLDFCGNKIIIFSPPKAGRISGAMRPGRLDF